MQELKMLYNVLFSGLYDFVLAKFGDLIKSQNVFDVTGFLALEIDFSRVI